MKLCERFNVPRPAACGSARITKDVGPGTPNQGFIGSLEFQGLFAN
jgi:hypothetical protein